MSDWILIAGYGSIGRRHFRNLKSMGYGDVRLVRSGRKPTEGFETPSDTFAYENLESALADGPRMVVVANPTSLHVDVARAAMLAGASVLLEKPVCTSVDEARELEAEVFAANGICSMAYCFRYHPLYAALADLVHAGRLGRVFHLHTWQASFLPDWHPWENYLEGYAARSDLGGGVVRTLDHDLDLIRWIAGQPTEVIAAAGSLSGIGVEVEDTADMIFRFPERKQAHVHVSFGRRDYTRGMWVVGEDASASLDWTRGTVVLRDGKQVIDEIFLPNDYDLNNMYLEMAKDALDNFALDPPRAPVPLANGVAALEMATAALESSRTSKAVSITAVEEVSRWEE